MHACIHICRPTCMCICVYIYMHAYMYALRLYYVCSMHECMHYVYRAYVCIMYVCMALCMHVYMYIYACMLVSFVLLLSSVFFYSIVSSISFSWSQLVTFSVLLIIFSSSLTQSIFFPFCFLSPGVPYCLSTWLFIFLSYSVCLSLTFYLCFLSRRGAYLQLFTLCNLKLHCRESIRWGINTAIAGGWWTHLEGAE